MGSAVRQFEKEVSSRLGTGVEYVTSSRMGRAVRHFEKEVSFKLGKGVENVASICMGRAVRQFEKEVSFRLETGAGYMLHRTVWDAPSASSKRKLVLN